jgi:aryl sulfotransferase
MQDAVAPRPPTREYRYAVWDSRRWVGFVHRPGDIFVCTPPKCGTTWMQTIVATLLFPAGDAPGPVWKIAPWLDARFDPIDEILARLDAQPHRRSIKTHTPADGIPWFPDARYIVVGRDGRDAFMSFVNHMLNLRPDLVERLLASAIEEGIELAPPPPLDDIHAFFAYWLETRMLFDHIGSYWNRRAEPNLLFVHFDDLKADLAGEMRRVAAFLGIEIADERWPELVDRCTFASMKARSDEIAPFEEFFVGGAETFLYKGTNGRWRDVLTPDELAAYDRAGAAFLPPGAATWLAGRTGSASS